jgi:hypothetical protein
MLATITTIGKITLSLAVLLLAAAAMRVAFHAFRLAWLRTLIPVRFGGPRLWGSAFLLPVRWATDFRRMLASGVPETVCYKVTDRRGKMHVGLFFNDMSPRIRVLPVDKFLSYEYVFDFQTTNKGGSR